MRFGVAGKLIEQVTNMYERVRREYVCNNHFPRGYVDRALLLGHLYFVSWHPAGLFPDVPGIRHLYNGA